jgi:hypothetical protein
MKPGEAGAVAAALRRQHRPLDEGALRRYFVEERQLIQLAHADSRRHLHEIYQVRDLEGMGRPELRIPMGTRP